MLSLFGDLPCSRVKPVMSPRHPASPPPNLTADALLAAQDKAAALFDEVVDPGLIRPGAWEADFGRTYNR